MSARPDLCGGYRAHRYPYRDQQLLQHQSPRANKRLEPELALLRKFKEWMASCESFVEYSYEVAAIK